jgi:hypothetical protein
MNPQALLKLCGEYQSFCRKISTVVSQQQVPPPTINPCAPPTPVNSLTCMSCVCVCVGPVCVSCVQTVLCTRMRAKEGQSLEASRTLQRHLGDVRQFEMAFRDGAFQL